MTIREVSKPELAELVPGALDRFRRWAHTRGVDGDGELVDARLQGADMYLWAAYRTTRWAANMLEPDHGPRDITFRDIQALFAIVAPREAMTLLAASPNVEVRLAAVERVGIDPRVLHALVDDPAWEVRATIAQHFRATDAAIAHLANDDNAAVAELARKQQRRRADLLPTNPAARQLVRAIAWALNLKFRRWVRTTDRLLEHAERDARDRGGWW